MGYSETTDAGEETKVFVNGRDELEQVRRMLEAEQKLVLFDELGMRGRIGEGRNAYVYSANYRGLLVAVKFFKNVLAVDEFVKEFEIMDSLTEVEGVVRLVGVCVSPKAIVMEHLDASLHEVIHEFNFSFSLQDQLNIALQIASTMRQLHEQEPFVIHRDLITPNILLNKSLGVKIADFGVALRAKSSNSTIGHPRYIAPEVISQLRYSKEVDVYYFATILFELFTKTVFFVGLDEDSVRQKVVCGERPVIPTQVPERIAQLINQCWGAPQERPSFAQIEGELLSFLEESTL